VLITIVYFIIIVFAIYYIILIIGVVRGYKLERQWEKKHNKKLR